MTPGTDNASVPWSPAARAAGAGESLLAPRFGVFFTILIFVAAVAMLTGVVILAEDIHAEEGAILLRKGTRITTRVVDRLRELAVETTSPTFVWIGDLA